MKKFTMIACLAAALVFAIGATAGERPNYSVGSSNIIHGGNVNAMKSADRDTVYLIGPWGSGAVVNGQFEDVSGAANWNGWTSLDLTQKTEPVWHVDTYNVVSGTYSAWCGEDIYEACVAEDPPGGYGHAYNELLVMRAVAGNSGAATTVDVAATVNHNTEPGYDFSNLGYYKADAAIAYLWTADGEGEQVPVIASVTYQPGEYVGTGGNEIAIAWHVTSDGGWDDSDCDYYGDGALQIDDITVTVDNDGNTATYTDDFEDGLPLPVQTDPASIYGDWAVEYPVGVGDYAHLRTQLGDEDPCASNFSPQVCFMADDIMFNAGGHPVAYCQDWCYGPGGYIVNTQGGFAGPTAHLYNSVRSPVIAWPEGDYLGVRFLFDVYRHEDLSADSPGMFYEWGIRSTDSTDPADIENATFFDRNLVYYGGPDYFREGDLDATDLVVPGRNFVQVRFAANELGYIWGWDGDDGFPAPYGDNFNLICYDYYGPGMTADEIRLAQDAFPTDGQIHVGTELDQNDVRFDMANFISLATDLRNDPGDSITCDIVAVRSGSSLVETFDGLHRAPTMYFQIKLNPLYDSSMRIGAGAFTCDSEGSVVLAGEVTDDGASTGIMIGYVTGAPAEANGVPSPDRWMFDLPDEDLLYPGDVLHYYFEAWDEVTGDFQNATIPADISGYGDFSKELAYDSSFMVHALPTMTSESGDQPSILFWNDFGNRGGENEWYGAFENLGFFPGEQYDVFYTNAPSSSIGNGLGGRAQLGQLNGYDILLYTSGDLTVTTISNQDFNNDPGDDVGVLNNWLEQGGKSMFATGDDLISDMVVNGGTSTQAFVTNWMGLNHESNDARALLGGDTAPMVYPVSGNSVFETIDGWIAYGGCRIINSFDAVTVMGGEQLAVFNDGTNGLSAATKFTAPNGSTVITMPYDFMYIRTAPDAAKAGQPAPIPTRARILGAILSSFGAPPRAGFETGADMPGVAFTASAYPNPFNPTTKIEFKMPKPGHLSLKVYDVRGQLVRTLIDEVRESSGHVMWDGTSDQGKRVSSGVYFYEARTDGKSVVNKMALVK